MIYWIIGLLIILVLIILFPNLMGDILEAVAEVLENIVDGFKD